MASRPTRDGGVRGEGNTRSRKDRSTGVGIARPVYRTVDGDEVRLALFGYEDYEGYVQ